MQVVSRVVLGGAVALLPIVSACHGNDVADAYGNFEAVEVVVSSQTSGQIQRFVPVEGMTINKDSVVVLIDTTQLALERKQVEAQRGAVSARDAEVAEQLRVLQVQRDIALRGYERTKRLHAVNAATDVQLDQAEREYKVLETQIAAAQAQRRSVALEVSSASARVAQIQDRLARSQVENPVRGNVLAVYAREGEVVQAGQPLYKIANLDTLDLRVYITADQLPRIKIGEAVRVHVTAGDSLDVTEGIVTWVSDKAEFTPTPIQTRDDRADLVYAVKIRVPNAHGILKIGMPADVTFSK